MELLDAPITRLAGFREKLGLGREAQPNLARHAEALGRRSEDFAEYLHGYFMAIPETRAVLLHQSRPGRLRGNWSRWFESLFRHGPTDAFLIQLWQSGLIHVQVSIDQRWINLAYALARRFLRQTVRELLSGEERDAALDHLDAVLDLCVLVATDAFVAGTTKCDREVIMGVAHQVRNPITVIGGNVQRLRRMVAPHVEGCEACDIILFEAMRLERMLRNLGDYIDMFQRQPEPAPLALEPLLLEARERALQELGGLEHGFELALDPAWPDVMADAKDLRAVFFHLLHNALEALSELPAAERELRLASSPEDRSGDLLRVTVFNAGEPPSREEIPDLLRPFHSKRSMGTGFGLPIARLGAIKSLGDLVLEPLANGLACHVSLPTPH